MINLSVFLLSLLISFSAQSLTVEGFLHIPWSTVQQELASSQDATNYKEDFALNALTVSSSFGPVTIPETSGTVAYSLAPVSFQGSQMLVASSRIEIGLLIPAMTIQKQISRTIGGIQVIVDLKATCSPIQLTQAQSSARALVQWQLQNKEVQGVISNFDFQWPTNSWEISPIQCVGPVGFADLIEQELRSQLSDATQFASQIRSFLESSLNKKVNALLVKVLQAHFLQLQNATYQYQLQALQNISESGIDFSVLVSNGKSSGSIQGQDFRRLLPTLSTTRTSLVFGQKDFQEFLKAFLVQQSLQTPLNNFLGFTKLLQSRFLQFFIWPDLMNFSKNASFMLNTQLLPHSRIGLNIKKSWDLDLQLGSWVVADRDKVAWNYLLIRNRLQGQLALKIEKSQLVLSPFLQKMNSQVRFGEDYVRRFDPCTAISISTLEDAVKKSLFEKNQFLQIPAFQMEGLTPFLLEQYRFGPQNEMIFEFGT